MSPFAQFIAAAILGIPAGFAAAADFDPAAYHQAQCTRCHDASVYTRSDRRIQSYAALKAQVARCDINLAQNLPPDELDQLVEYINTTYYKFPH